MGSMCENAGEWDTRLDTGDTSIGLLYEPVWLHNSLFHPLQRADVFIMQGWVTINSNRPGWIDSRAKTS